MNPYAWFCCFIGLLVALAWPVVAGWLRAAWAGLSHPAVARLLGAATATFRALWGWVQAMFPRAAPNPPPDLTRGVLFLMLGGCFLALSIQVDRAGFEVLFGPDESSALLRLFGLPIPLPGQAGLCAIGLTLALAVCVDEIYRTRASGAGNVAPVLLGLLVALGAGVSAYLFRERILNGGDPNDLSADVEAGSLHIRAAVGATYAFLISIASALSLGYAVYVVERPVLVGTGAWLRFILAFAVALLATGVAVLPAIALLVTVGGFVLPLVVSSMIWCLVLWLLRPAFRWLTGGLESERSSS